METRSTTATTADAYVSAETPRSTAYLLANRLFADAPQRTEIIVKRRRLVQQEPLAIEPPEASPSPDLAAPPSDGNRAPRVFVVARDEAVAAVPVEPTPERTEQTEQTELADRPGRRRVEAQRMPGKVVLIVPPRTSEALPGALPGATTDTPTDMSAQAPSDAPLEPASADPMAGDLDLMLARVDEHRELKAALERVRALTADAMAARKFRF